MHREALFNCLHPLPAAVANSTSCPILLAHLTLALAAAGKAATGLVLQRLLQSSKQPLSSFTGREH